MRYLVLVFMVGGCMAAEGYQPAYQPASRPAYPAPYVPLMAYSLGQQSYSAPAGLTPVLCPNGMVQTLC
jgi:hypothetical protein